MFFDDNEVMRNIEMTDKQKAFVVALVTKACSGTEAAEIAGYSAVSARQQASNLLKLEHVQAGIREYQFRVLNADLANVALATLRDVMIDKSAPAGSRVSAAIAVLERSGLHHDIKSAELEDSTKNVNDMSRSELEQFIQVTKQKIADYDTERMVNVEAS